MTIVGRRILLGGLLFLVVATGGAAPAVAELPAENLAVESVAAGEDVEADLTSTSGNVELTQRLSLVPDQPGMYGVSHRYQLPDALGVLEVTVPEGAEVRSMQGFVHQDGRTYEWDRSTDRPRLDYHNPANRSVDQTGPIAGPGQYIFVDVGEWAIVSQPQTSHRWGWQQGTQRVGFDSEMTTTEGATSDAIAYLGPYEERTHTAHGQRFRLIVPGEATLRERPGELFESLSDASDQLRVGERDEEVFMIAAPTDSGVEWGVRGLQTGPADMWVRDRERLSDPNNVWLHEYVHTRQGYVAESDARWFTEGGATYYAALLSLEQERISFSQFSNRLQRGEGSYSGSIMSRPNTWSGNADYHVGALTAGELDRQIRLASDGERSFQDVFRQMNAKEGTVSGADVQTSLREAGGRSVADSGQRYITTTERPAMWTDQQHHTAFGDIEPARITYALSSTDPLRVDGEYRTRPLDPAEPITVVPGEQLSLRVTAENFGGIAGDYEAVFRVNDDQEATRSGRLDPGASTDLTFDHMFDEPGLYTVSVGDVSLLVEVREPATASVSEVRVDRTTVAPGEAVTLTAEVRNDAAYPGALELQYTTNGEVTDTETIRLDANSQTTRSKEFRFDEPGTVVLGAGDRIEDTVVITVSEEPVDDEIEESVDDKTAGEPGTPADDETDEEIDSAAPGFGPAVAVLSLLAVSLLVGRRR